jgi:hypothetical protein
MGDSIGEGVQSANASAWGQPYSYINLIAIRMGAPFPLPYIQTGVLSLVGDVSTRSRLYPTVPGLNLAVSGADTFSLINDRATATSTATIATETDLVLFPRLGSQLEIAETLRPGVVACWIGSNDVLQAVTSYNQLDVSQMTPPNEFFDNFATIAFRLWSMNSKVVFGTIPDVSQIGYLVDRNDLIKYLGNDYGLPAGSRTTVVAMILIGLGQLSPAVLQDPNYVLDPTELATISQRVTLLNQIIRFVANYYGMGVADINALLQQYSTNPPVFSGIPLTNKFLGGLFSLDGVHPSDIAHGLIANEFISAFNSTYALNISPIDPTSMNYLFATDPYVDFNRNGRVRGRPLTGLLEFVSVLIGFSGDSESLPVSASAVQAMDAKAAAPQSRYFTPDSTKRFFEEYQKAKGKDLRKASKQEVEEAFMDLFGLSALKKNNRH